MMHTNAIAARGVIWASVSCLCIAKCANMAMAGHCSTEKCMVGYVDQWKPRLQTKTAGVLRPYAGTGAWSISESLLLLKKSDGSRLRIGSVGSSPSCGRAACRQEPSLTYTLA